MKAFVGQSRAENLKWLTKTWLKEGPPVCFLQGFAGVGKTDLARDFRELAEKEGRKPAVINEVADRPTPNFLESLMELSLMLEQQGLPEMAQSLFGQGRPNLGFAVECALRRPVVIILDEAQRFFRPESGNPLSEMNGVLAFLRNRQNLAGRLLLISDRIVEEGRWSEWIPKRTVEKLSSEEALRVLNARLQESGLAIEIPAARRTEVVGDLDCNPRAIEALVGALKYDSLDDIIESNPGLWAVRDREVSREFLRALERVLLERSLRHLDPAQQRKLRRLAVHRRSFKRQALERQCANQDEAAAVRSALLGAYLLNFYKGALSLNPIVREIALARLREEPAEFKQAHSAAAEYHLRHFTAKQIVGGDAQLGAAFAELRYHLVQAGREAELAAIGQRFTEHLKQELQSASSVPSDAEELDERIAVLSALLEHGGAKGLEYHLARCLERRGRAEDLKQAVTHSRQALDRNYAHSWVLCANLLAKTNQLPRAVTLLKEGIQAVPADKNVFALYQACADLLAKAGRSDEAVTLLKQGIQAVPADKGVFALYQLCANLLAKAGRSDEAVTLLKQGIQSVPADKSVFSLYQSCADLLAKAGRSDEAVTLLKQGIQSVPADKGAFALYTLGADLLAKAGRSDEAVTLLKQGIQSVPADKSLSMLYQSLAQVYCRAGQINEAIAIFREGSRRIGPQFNGYTLVDDALYLCAASNQDERLAELVAEVGVTHPQSAALGNVLRLQRAGDWAAAAAAASTARQHFPSSFAFASQEALSRLAAGQAEAAWLALKQFPELRFRTGDSHVWLAAFIQLRRGAHAEAAELLATYVGRPIDRDRELNEAFLLSLWDEQAPTLESRTPCFHYPLLPAALTGGGQDVRRVPYSKPVLRPQTLGPPPAAGAATIPVAGPPEIYVSYAWGEDASDEGRKREQIVDLLCDTVRQAGRVIGRDKERMRGGDSIERFAHEISKAKRIIAVISAKSLRSQYCMAHELFRAYRRCDYQRSEFQEKVIALVMDDARPLLRDDLALVRLAGDWRQQVEELLAELRAVDPNRKSAALWVFVDLLEDMCPRLPDMLGALKDIVMKRGFEEIVKDNFAEVLARLPAGENK